MKNLLAILILLVVPLTLFAQQTIGVAEGRFKIVAFPDKDGSTRIQDRFLLDTETGRSWHLQFMADGKQTGVYYTWTEILRQALPSSAKELSDTSQQIPITLSVSSEIFTSSSPASIETTKKELLALLKKQGYTETHLAKIEEIGVDKLDWDPVLKNLDFGTRTEAMALLLKIKLQSNGKMK